MPPRSAKPVAKAGAKKAIPDFGASANPDVTIARYVVLHSAIAN